MALNWFNLRSKTDPSSFGSSAKYKKAESNNAETLAGSGSRHEVRILVRKGCGHLGPQPIPHITLTLK